MKRLTEIWFEFAGVRCDAMGVELEEMPTRAQPAQNGKWVSVAGRSGRVWQSDGTWSNVPVSVKCAVPESDKHMRAVSAWLVGEGRLVFSDEPDAAYEARVVDSFKRSSIAKRLTGQKFTVVFDCQPFRLLLPEAEAFTAAASGTAFENPGTAPSLPRVTIRASGAFSVTIAQQTMWFHDVVDGIIVDSLKGNAFTLDGTLLANSLTSGPLYKIPPGTFTVDWLCDEGGSVESVEILPRWRCR